LEECAAIIFRVEEYPHCKIEAAGSSKTFVTTYQDLESLHLKASSFAAISMSEFCHKIYANEVVPFTKNKSLLMRLILNVYVIYQETVMTFK
jgi:hypothetical protein